MRAVLAGLFFVMVLGIFAHYSYAQSGESVAINIEVPDAEPGDIVSLSKDGHVRSATPYEATIFGVVVSAPILSTGEKTDKTKSVITSGSAQVKVKLGASGAIKEGDFITSSSEAGVGQKAERDGYILGKALAAYEDSSKIGLVPVQLGVAYFPGPAKRLDPAVLIRYGAAFLFGVIAFLAATFAFVRFLTTGITALGRNPMAKRPILGAMFFSGLVVVILAASGVLITAAIIAFLPK